jgi:hypothetical protein
MAGSQKQTASRLAWDAALAGLSRDDAADRLVERLDGFVEWPSLLQESRADRLTPLVYTGLKQALRDGAKVPGQYLQAFQRETMRAGIRLAYLEAACERIVDRADGAGIPILVLKGLALAATVYPPGIPRPMDDIDLLVRETDRERLAEILCAQGYRNDLRGEEDFFHPSRMFSVDVHTAPVNVTRIPARRALWPVTFDKLWERHRTFKVGDNLLHTLGPLDTALHLATHAVHHHGLAGRLWMVDLLLCMEKWPLTIDTLGAAAPSAHRSLWYCLQALALQGLDSSPDIRTRIQPQRLHPGEQRILAAASQGKLPEAIRYGFTFLCLPGIRSRAGFLRQILFPRRDMYRRDFADMGSVTPRWISYWQMAAGLATKTIAVGFRRHT